LDKANQYLEITNRRLKTILIKLLIIKIENDKL
jgi:hypothetical protein